MERKDSFSKRLNDYVAREFPISNEKAKFRSVEKDILKALRQGHKKTHIYEFLKSEQTLTCSYQTFCRFLRESQEESEQKVPDEQITNNKPDQTLKQQEEQKPDNSLTVEQPETIQVVEGEKSETLKRIEEHRQRVQAQRAAEATTEIKPEQQIETNAQQDTQETEEREFGKLPKGKVWSELSEELKETIRSERRQLDAEEREKRKQQQIEAAVAEREASKLHHDPNPKPPGYWKKG